MFKDVSRKEFTRLVKNRLGTVSYVDPIGEPPMVKYLPLGKFDDGSVVGYSFLVNGIETDFHVREERE